MSDERKRENEEEKLKDFFHNVIGIKSEAVLRCWRRTRKSVS